MKRPPPISSHFPYTTLFRSVTKPERRECAEKSPSPPASAQRCFTMSRTAAGDRGSPTWPPLRMRRKIDRKSTRLNSSHLVISYAVFCLKKKKNTIPFLFSHLLLTLRTYPHIHTTS